MTDKLDRFIATACDIADQLGNKDSVDVALAMLRLHLPRDVLPDGRTLAPGLILLLDAVGICSEWDDGKSVRFRRRTRETGMLDQAIRIRDGFRQKLWGPIEHLPREVLSRLASYGRAGANDGAGPLGEALEAVGFRSLGSWATKWNRYRLIVPEHGVTLQLGDTPLRLAMQTRVTNSAAVRGDKLLGQHFPEFAKYTCPAQRDAIRVLVEDDEAEVVIAKLPTGSGKSLLYLLPSAEWHRRGEPATCVIVSPVVALQNDQMRKIREHYHRTGTEGAEINSTVPATERDAIYRKLRAGRLDALFLSPEKLVDPFFQQILIDAAQHIRLFVVDEAHIVADWGQDFRTDFFRLGVVRNRLRQANPRIRTLLLSATLTQASEAVVLQVFHNPEKICRFEQPSLRTELSIRVVRHDNHSDRETTLRKLIAHVPRPCIVYCARRKHVQELRRTLRNAGLRRFLEYSGATDPPTRVERLEAFHRGDVDFVLATSAFGLGVDKADVRTVIHYDVPGNLDEYYQQIGRAARDRWTGHAFLLDSAASRGRATRDKIAIIKTETAAARALAMLSNRVDLPCDGPGGCLVPLHVLPEHVEQESGLNRKWNFAVLNILQRVGDLEVDRAILRHAWVRSGAHPERIARYPLLQKALRPALRNTKGREFDLADYAVKQHVSLSELEHQLVAAILDCAVELILDDTIDDHARVEWVLARRLGSGNTWSLRHAARLDEHRQQRLALAAKQRKELGAFLSGRSCRMRVFGRIYGHAAVEDCGRCDVCDRRLAWKPLP